MAVTLFGGGHSVIQMQSTTFDGVTSTSVAGSPSTSNAGVQLLAINFTPLSASSKILVQTSTIGVAEEANGGDIPWVALWVGSTFVAANSGNWLYSHFAGSLNSIYANINHVWPSWGTVAQVVQVRAGINAGTAYINGGSVTSYNYTGNSARISMTVMEITTT